MKSFNEYLTETPLNSNFEDIYKRKNKDNFNKKALSGELELENGGKMLPLGKDDYALEKIMSVSDVGDLKPEIGNIRKHIKSNWGVDKISDISKDLNGFSPGESGNPSGEDWEALIAVAVKKESGRTFVETDEWNRISKYWGDWGDSAIKIGNEFIKRFKINDLNQLGSSTLPTSTHWTKYGATNKTPKTDLLQDKHKISLKKAGGSQLMSAGKEEAIATVNAAMMTFGQTKAGKVKISSVIDTLEEKMVKLSEKGTVGSIEALKGKSNLTQRELDRIAELEDGHLKANDINNKLDDIFTDLKFKSHFCFEAATGNIKFMDSPEGASNMMVVFKDTGKVSDTLTLDNADKAGMVLAKGNKFYVSFKSSSGSKPYLALRTSKMTKKDLARMNEETKSFKQIINEEINNSGIFLTEELQQLDEFAIFSKLANKVKNVASNVLNKIKKVWEAIMARVKMAFNYIKKLGKMAIRGLMNFFGLDIKTVKVNGGGKYPLM
jgi:hypothetical protein